MTKSRPNVVRKPTYKAPRKPLATRAVAKPASPKPSSPKLSSPKADISYPYTNPELAAERCRKFAPPMDEELFDNAVEYCEKRLVAFREAFYLATCYFINEEVYWLRAIRNHNKFITAFESFFQHVAIKYGFDGKCTTDDIKEKSKLERAIRSSEGSSGLHQWRLEMCDLIRPSIKALESSKKTERQTNTTKHR